MFTLIIGGAAGGKSEFAEKHVLSLSGRRIYLATMEPFGAEGRARVEKHRRQRAGKGFETVERYTDLASVRLPGGANILLECLGNLTAAGRTTQGTPSAICGNCPASTARWL